MKKALLIMLFFIGIYQVNATNLYNVTLINCDKANTYMVKENENVKRIKLIAFDGKGTDSEYLDNYVCSLISNAKKIEIEYDKESKDEYNRYPVWVYIDGIMLQEKLIKEGLGQVNYVKNDYNYLNHLCKIQKNARNEKIGIWSNNIEEKYCENDQEKTTTKVKKYADETKEKYKNTKYIHYILSINGIMIVLIFILRRIHNEER